MGRHTFGHELHSNALVNGCFALCMQSAQHVLPFYHRMHTCRHTHTHTHLKVYQAWTGMHTVAAELGSKRSCTGKLHWICKQEICSLEQGTLGLEQGSAWTCHCGCCCSRIVPHKGVRGPFESSHTIHERSSFREKSLPFAMIEMVRVEWQPCA